METPAGDLLFCGGHARRQYLRLPFVGYWYKTGDNFTELTFLGDFDEEEPDFDDDDDEESFEEGDDE